MNTIEVYDRLSGALLHKWPIAGGVGENGVSPQLDASGGIAVYIAGPSLHALDHLTGKDVVVATHRARVVFVPFATVAQSVGRS